MRIVVKRVIKFMNKILISLMLVFIILFSINVFNYSVSAFDTVDRVMIDAQNFLDKGSSALGKIDQTTLSETSDFIYNLLLAIAVVVAVIVGMVIGIQFMTSSVEEKAKVKESLVPYVVGCVVIFGAFGIWRLAIIILSRW